MNRPTPDEHNILVDAIYDSATVIHKGKMMNERIREVWIKAAREDSDPDNWDTQKQFIERFAELIVKECVRHFNEDYQRDFDTLWRDDLSKSIKEHFGVEE